MEKIHLKYFDVKDNAEVEMGNNKYGVRPWRVVDNDGENVYVFSIGVPSDEVKVWADLVKLEAEGAGVSAAAEWYEEARNAIIDAF